MASPVQRKKTAAGNLITAGENRYSLEIDRVRGNLPINGPPLFKQYRDAKVAGARTTRRIETRSLGLIETNRRTESRR